MHKKIICEPAYLVAAISLALLSACGGGDHAFVKAKESASFVGPANKPLDPTSGSTAPVGIFLTDFGETKLSNIGQQNSPAVALFDVDGSQTHTVRDRVDYNQVAFLSAACIFEECGSAATAYTANLPEGVEPPNGTYAYLDISGNLMNTIRITVDSPSALVALTNDAGTSKIDRERINGRLVRTGGTIDRRFGAVLQLRDMEGNNLRSAYFRYPPIAGWSYQTFLRYYNTPDDQTLRMNRDLLQGYQSIGSPTPNSDVPERKWADYQGISHALYNGNQVTMENKIHADFANRSLSYRTEQTPILHTFENGEHIIEKRPDMSLSGSASWAKGQSRFNGTIRAANGLQGRLEGQFYGPQAAEVGGVFGMKGQVNGASVDYIGGFGAKR